MPKKEHKHLIRIKRYQNIFNSSEGEAVLHDLMAQHHVLNQAFVAGDPYQSAFNEGERNVVLRILTLLKTDPRKLHEQINKAIEEEKNYV